jgi:hypothetical protein
MPWGSGGPARERRGRLCSTLVFPMSPGRCVEHRCQRTEPSRRPAVERSESAHSPPAAEPEFLLSPSWPRRAHVWPGVPLGMDRSSGGARRLATPARRLRERRPRDGMRDAGQRAHALPMQEPARRGLATRMLVVRCEHLARPRPDSSFHLQQVSASRNASSTSAFEHRSDVRETGGALASFFSYTSRTILSVSALATATLRRAPSRWAS